LYVGGQHLATGQTHAGGARRTRRDDDLRHLGVVLDGAPELLEHLQEAPHQRAGAPHGKPHAPLLLELVDQGVDGGGLERIAAHEQRVEREHLPQSLVADEAVHVGHHGAIGAKAHEIRDDLQHVGELAERLVDQRHAGPEDALDVLDEARVSVEIRRVEPCDLAPHLGGVPVVVEHRAVLEPHVVVRVEADEVHIVGGALARERKDLVEQPRRRDDRRARVERVAVALEHIGAPAGLVELLNDVDLVPLCTKPNGGAQPAEP
jgi:hypothetical protein